MLLQSQYMLGQFVAVVFRAVFMPHAFHFPHQGPWFQNSCLLQYIYNKILH